jgi:glycosyltransferase involved in cell wall biosynthesis
MLKKVLAICPEFNEEFVRYQPWKQIHQLGKQMIALGIQFVIATNATNLYEIDGIKILKLNDKKLRELSEVSIKKICEYNPEIIFWQGNPLSGTYIKKNNLNGIPIVVYISTVHMLWNELKNLKIKEIFPSNIINFFTSFWPFSTLVKNLNHSTITKIIVPNNSVFQRLVKLGVNNNKILQAPLCFQSDVNADLITNPLKSTKPFVLCYLGPSYSIRGTDILFDSVEELVKSGYDVKLLFLLRSPNPNTEKIFFEKLSQKKSIADNVVIKAGFLTKDELNKNILSSNLVVIPTKFVWNEPPLAILETMNLGVPVVASDVCGLSELISDNGFLIKPTSESLTNFIKDVFNNPKILTQAGEKGKNYVNSLPGWNKMTEWTIEAFESIKHVEDNE